MLIAHCDVQDRIFVCAKCVDTNHHRHTVTSPRTALFKTFDQIRINCEELATRANAIDASLDALTQLQQQTNEESERYFMSS